MVLGLVMGDGGTASMYICVYMQGGAAQPIAIAAQ